MCDVEELRAASEAGPSEAAILPERGVQYLHGLFDKCRLLQQLEALRPELPGDRTSQNMTAIRRRFHDEAIAAQISAALPPSLCLRALPDMRFIEYPLGGYIAPHVDGPSFDEASASLSTHTFLLYLRDTSEGGATHILSELNGDTLASLQPVTGSILLFPHATAHWGDVVGDEPKVLLRGDLVCERTSSKSETRTA
jgi:hypothetical protein